MKIILSRKGFDSGSGGIASPILPDGTLLSLPIPDKKGNRKYNELRYDDITYYDIINQLRKRCKNRFEHINCHLDPDIRENICYMPNKWKSAFGQFNGALKHLINQNVKKGDMFLFYGWFKKTEYGDDGKLQYITNAPNLHVIYGFLQIGRMITDKEEIKKYNWHPHANMVTNNNCLFVANDRLSWNENKKGYGTFLYNKQLALTKEGTRNRSEWGKLFNMLKNNNLKMSGHRQEYVIDEHPIITEWVQSLI